MVISWYGQSCFKIQSGELVLVSDPYHKDIGLTPPRFKADILVVTHEHLDHNNIETIPTAGEIGGAFVVRGPGEYEVKNVAITGIPTFHDDKKGKERGPNTCYVIEMEDIRIGHLGDFGEAEIRPETLEALGEIDILLVPVGGTYTIDAEVAAEVVNAIEPKIVIPMHYAISGIKAKLAGVGMFLKEMGIKNGEEMDRLTIKKKDLIDDNKSAKTVVLRPVNS
ncbi:MAG: MBL fold metallo-hydrolase [Candidatus Sungbacteria bacterium]|nr:MBL fold metallo-hydrolase [Candidatus Sungbacteria bacterium]